MNFKTVSLPSDVWAKINRRITVEVGADDESRKWAGMIDEQVKGSVKVKATRGSVEVRAPRGGDLRNAKLLG